MAAPRPLQVKEITLSSSKSIEFGEFKSSVSLTLEIPEGQDFADCQEEVVHWRRYCDATTEEGIKAQIERKKARKAKKND